VDRTDQTQAQPSPAQQPWPADVDARYLTIGGATVDLTFSDDITPHTKNADAECRGCGQTYAIDAEHITRLWAQHHAEHCRAMPRPAAA
jgi:hypothetical protein